MGGSRSFHSLPTTSASFYWNSESNAVVVWQFLKENNRLAASPLFIHFSQLQEKKTNVPPQRREANHPTLLARPRRSRQLFISGPAARQHERRRYKDGVVCAICVSAACFSVFTQGSIPRLSERREDGGRGRGCCI